MMSFANSSIDSAEARQNTKWLKVSLRRCLIPSLTGDKTGQTGLAESVAFCCKHTWDCADCWPSSQWL